MVEVRLDGRDILCTAKLDRTLEEISSLTGKPANEIICETLQVSKPLMDSNLGYERLTPEGIINITTHVNYSSPEFSIKRPSRDGLYCYYIHPSGSSHFELTLKNPATGISEHTTFVGPSNIINLDCDGQAVTELIKQVTREYLAAQDISRQPLWIDFLNIPNDFLKVYGIAKLPKPDTMLFIEHDATDAIIPENARP